MPRLARSALAETNGLPGSLAAGEPPGGAGVSGLGRLVRQLARRWNFRARRWRERERWWRARVARLERERAALVDELTEGRRREAAMKRDAAAGEAVRAAQRACLDAVERELRVPGGATDGGERLAAELRALREIDAGALRLEPTECDLAAVLRAAVAAGLRATEAPTLEVRLEIGAAVPPMVRVDARRLAMLVERLVAHAAATIRRGELRLRVRFEGPRPGGWRLRGEIDVAGMAGGARMEPAGGVRLGLVLARRLAGLMGGEVVAEETRGLRGTAAFTVETGWAGGKLAG